MNLNLEILQFFVYKKIIDKKDIEEILPECDRLGLPVDRYLISHGYCNDIAATAALGEYYCMPYIEMDMLTVDEALIDTAELAYLKRHKIVPVSIKSVPKTRFKERIRRPSSPSIYFCMSRRPKLGAELFF